MSDGRPGWDWTDGCQVPPMRVETDQLLQGVHQGSVRVAPGATFTIAGTQQGSVHVESSAAVVILGQLQGSLHLASGATATVRGAQQGSVHLADGAELDVTPTGRLAGSLHNDGVIRNHGARGGTVSGRGVLKDLPGSQVKHPQTRDGVIFYTWP